MIQENGYNFHLRHDVAGLLLIPFNLLNEFGLFVELSITKENGEGRGRG